MRYWRDVKQVVKEADVIIEVADARMPDLSRNKDIEQLVKDSKKELIVVYNKCDLVSDKFVGKTEKGIKESYFFISVKENKGIKELRKMLHILSKKSKFDRLRVAFVGYPNVGKSSLVNFIVRQARAKVAKKAGTTRGIQWISFSDFKILDSPGVIPNDEWDEVKLALISAKTVQQIKNPEKVAIGILEMFLEKAPEALEEFYGIDSSKDVYDIFEEIGTNKRFLRKGAEIDEMRTAVAIVNDWQKGKLRL